ncbi:MAG: hypothetical protein NTW86_02025 [Candidatus Sumerlaeota bacterium]|nr:hypothetical protein [Candidatus Sumerlaeota bacterium]
MKQRTDRFPGAWLLACAAIFLWTDLSRAEPPYPPSPVIAGIDWQFDSLVQHGAGSDQWPCTWADDDNVYAAWGDGCGWDKAGPKHSIGVTRIFGIPPDLRGEDLWGAGPGSGFGKPEALIAYDGSIYMFWTRGRSKDDAANTSIAVSSDYEASWTLREEKAFPWAPDGFRVRGIAQFGKGYEGAMDDFVYVYFGFSRANDLYLARAPKAAILDASRYEWFTGLDGAQPLWSREFERKRLAFSDPNGYIWHVGVTFVPSIGRFLFSKPHYSPGADRVDPEGDRSKVSGLGIFDAPKPWGPWTTVYYEDRFYDANFKFTYFIPAKYLSADGKSLWLTWSGPPEYDNVNFVRGVLRLE